MWKHPALDASAPAGDPRNTQKQEDRDSERFDERDRNHDPEERPREAGAATVEAYNAKSLETLAEAGARGVLFGSFCDSRLATEARLLAWTKAAIWSRLTPRSALSSPWSSVIASSLRSAMLRSCAAIFALIDDRDRAQTCYTSAQACGDAELGGNCGRCGDGIDAVIDARPQTGQHWLRGERRQENKDPTTVL